MSDENNPFFLMGALLGEKSGEVTDLRRRIEELEAENAKLKQMWWDAGDVTDLAGTIANLKAERDALREAVDEVTEYAKRHEAERNALVVKLAMALRALERIELSTDTREQGAIAMATLAALKGQDDE